MNRKDYLKRHKELCQEMYDTTKSKNTDYTGNDDTPFRNFTMVEAYGAVTAEQGFFTRMTDKMSRFSSFIKNGTLLVKDESVKDSLLDLANYCILCICYLEDKQDKKKKDGKK